MSQASRTGTQIYTYIHGHTHRHGQAQASTRRHTRTHGYIYTLHIDSWGGWGVHSFTSVVLAPDKRKTGSAQIEYTVSTNVENWGVVGRGIPDPHLSAYCPPVRNGGHPFIVPYLCFTCASLVLNRCASMSGNRLDYVCAMTYFHCVPSWQLHTLHHVASFITRCIICLHQLQLNITC